MAVLPEGAQVVWVPVSELAGLNLIHKVHEDWRMQSVRDGFRRWLGGHGEPLPPIVVRRHSSCACRPERSGHHVCGVLQGGHHRLSVAREMNIPAISVAYQPIGDDRPPPFGWPSDRAFAEARGRDLEAIVNTISQASANAVHAAMLACINRRRRSTYETFDEAAARMFAMPHEQAASGKIRSLALTVASHWAPRLQHAAAEATHLSHDEALSVECLPPLSEARKALDDLICALQKNPEGT